MSNLLKPYSSAPEWSNLVSDVYAMGCVEGMKHYPDKYFDLAIVDPPYGIGEDGRKSQSRRVSSKSWSKPKDSEYKTKLWDESTPPKEYFDELFRVSKNQIIWGANYFISKMPIDSNCWVVWDKKDGKDFSDFADCELAYTSFKSSVRMFKMHWVGWGAVNAGEKRIHPTQKPVALYNWLLKNYAKKGDKILDTHLGSGSSRIAAYKSGFDFVGFEIDEDYLRDSDTRFKNATIQRSIFEV